MANHIYDKDGNYVGKQLSDKEHESHQRKRHSKGQVGCGCLVIIVLLIWLFA